MRSKIFLNKLTSRVNPRLYDENYFKHSGGSKYFLKGMVDPIYYKAVVMAKLAAREQMTFLDIGCGRGDLIKVLLSKFKGPNIIGIDYSTAAVQIAKELFRDSPNVKIIKHDATSLLLDRGTVDCVFLLDVVEHLNSEDLSTVLNEAYKVMKRRGKLVIHTFPTRYMNNFSHSILKLLNKFSIGQEMHINTQTYFSMRDLLYRANFLTSGHLSILGNMRQENK